MALTQAEFAGRMLNDAGEALASKNVYVYDVGTTTQRGTDTTGGSGEWDITPSGGGPQYDVVMVNGSDKIRWSARDQVMNQTMQIVQPDANEYALTVSRTEAADSVEVAVFEGARSDEANEDEAYIDFRLSNSADEQTTIARLAWTIPTITDGSEEGRLEFHIMEAGSLTVQLQLDKTALSPMASDGLALGTAALEWSDLFLADAAVISFGDDQEVTLTHVHDTGILLSSTDQLQFGDSGTYIHQSADGVLDLVSDTEIEINATTVDLNGILLVDGTNISLDSTTTLNIDNSNTSNGITIGTATSAVPISIGHTNSETTVNDNLTVTGDLTVSGATTTVDTTNTVIKDALIKLAQGTTASPAVDLGLIFTRGNGSASNIANRAILWDESTDQFAFAFTNDEDGTTSGNVDIDDYADIKVGNIIVEDEVMTAKVSYTDGDDAMTIADGGAVTFPIGIDITGSAGITLQNDETITNSTNGLIAFSGGLTIPDAGKIGSASATSAMSIDSGGSVYVGADTSNGASTLGLNINQGAADDVILTLSSTDVNHGDPGFGWSGGAYDDAFALFKKAHAGAGGLEIVGIQDDEAGAKSGFVIQSITSDAGKDNTHTAAGRAAVQLNVWGNDGGSATDIGDGYNLFGVARYYEGGSGYNEKFIIDADGNFWFDGAAQTAFDEFNDTHLVRALDHARITPGSKDLIKSKWDDFVTYSESTLIELGILGDTIENGGLINMTGVQRLHNGAIWQLYTKLMDTESRLARTENKLLALEEG